MIAADGGLDNDSFESDSGDRSGDGCDNVDVIDNIDSTTRADTIDIVDSIDNIDSITRADIIDNFEGMEEEAMEAATPGGDDCESSPDVTESEKASLVVETRDIVSGGDGIRRGQKAVEAAPTPRVVTCEPSPPIAVATEACSELETLGETNSKGDGVRGRGAAVETARPGGDVRQSSPGVAVAAEAGLGLETLDEAFFYGVGARREEESLGGEAWGPGCSVGVTKNAGVENHDTKACFEGRGRGGGEPGWSYDYRRSTEDNYGVEHEGWAER